LVVVFWFVGFVVGGVYWVGLGCVGFGGGVCVGGGSGRGLVRVLGGVFGGGGGGWLGVVGVVWFCVGVWSFVGWV